METKTVETEVTQEKKLRREPSHSATFVLVGIFVLMSVILMIILAMFTSLKTILWLE